MDTSVRNQLQSIWSKAFFFGTLAILVIKFSWWLVILAVPLWIGLALLMAFGLQPIILEKFGLNGLTFFAWASGPIKAFLLIGITFLLF